MTEHVLDDTGLLAHREQQRRRTLAQIVAPLARKANSFEDRVEEAALALPGTLEAERVNGESWEVDRAPRAGRLRFDERRNLPEALYGVRDTELAVP